MCINTLSSVLAVISTSLFLSCRGRQRVAFPVLLDTQFLLALTSFIFVCHPAFEFNVNFMSVLCFVKQGVNFLLCEQ